MNQIKSDRVVFNDKMMLIQEAPRGASYLIEVPVTGANSPVPLPLIQELTSDTTQNVIIKSLRVVTDQELTNAPTLGNVVAPLTELQKISLIIYAEGWEKGYLIPILSLNNLFTEGSGIPYRDRTMKLDNWQNVMWNKSKLVYSNGTVPVGAPYVVLLETEYQRFDKQGREITGASTT
jgi:hypothetical protein